MMKTADFDYDLPPDLIAQTPLEPRDSSRLLVYNRQSKATLHTNFYEIKKFLEPGDLLVFNETRVIPARMYGRKLPGGGKVELLLLERIKEKTWEVLVGGKGLKTGRSIQVDNGPLAEIILSLDGARRVVRFSERITPLIEYIGKTPLPPYIHTELKDPDRYQTVYAHKNGSAAAPTAGLHFTRKLIKKLRSIGINLAHITLHIGLDTFLPVSEENPVHHKIHTEWCSIETPAVELINQTKKNGGRVIAVGTTCVRALESAVSTAKFGDTVGLFEGPTDLFILPGYSFKGVDALITNFHLPRSTLIMLVSAFAGRESILSSYKQAVELGYRFYSFGDAMLIL